MDDEEVPNTYDFLNSPLNLSDLISEHGAQFNIKPNFNDVDVGDIFEELNINSDDEDEEILERKQKDLASPCTRSFAEMRAEMEEIHELIYKRIIIDGNKTKGRVPNAARVAIRYSAYWEGEGAPFDSSFLRGNAFSFITGENEVLEGLEEAVRTMHEAETALFIISHKLLFREIGCLPRIKKAADALFKIDVIHFNLVGDSHVIDKLSEEDKNKFSFVQETIKQFHLRGLDSFKQCSYSDATRAFERAVDLLRLCHTANEEEQQQQQQWLIKFYTNLSLCYNKKSNPQKTCIIVQELKRLTNNKPNCKALFQEGRALFTMGDYEGARKSLCRALKMEPYNKEINDELCMLEERYKCFKKSERELCEKAFGIINKQKVDHDKKRNAEKAKEKLIEEHKYFLDIIEQFKSETSIKELKLMPGLSDKEIAAIKEMAILNNMLLTLSSLENSYVLVKQ